MEFNFINLKKSYINAESLGKWKGYNVFACPLDKVKDFGNGAVFIVYDDNNALVRKNDNAGWFKYGNVSENGRVEEHDPVRYEAYEKMSRYEGLTHAVCGKPAETCDGTMATATMGDVNLGIDVENVLKAAREMSVSSLLEGFNYGLEN